MKKHEKDTLKVVVQKIFVTRIPAGCERKSFVMQDVLGRIDLRLGTFCVESGCSKEGSAHGDQ